ncbi:MAG: 30S ribosomal protein S11 [Bacteroidetes bacterium]|nr:30S ribosomal protein S11 [Bacteroidota bacterium]
MAKGRKSGKRRTVKVEAEGLVHIKTSFNNTIITFTTKDGKAICWSSAGKLGFRGSKKNTPYAAQKAAQECAVFAYEQGLRKVEVYVKGPGAGREAAIRTIGTNGIDVTMIKDRTPLPHNGCRPPKHRRV